MSNNNDFSLTKEQQEAIDELMAAYVVLLSEYNEIHTDDVDMNVKSREFFDDNEAAFGTILAQLAIYFEFNIDYEQYTEFENFEELGDAFNHLAELHLINLGLFTREELDELAGNE